MRGTPRLAYLRLRKRLSPEDEPGVRGKELREGGVEDFTAKPGKPNVEPSRAMVVGH